MHCRCGGWQKSLDLFLRYRAAAFAVLGLTAELGYRITRDRWKPGIASRLDVSDAELPLTQAKSNYLQAVYDYLVAGVELDQALGRTGSGWNP